MSQKRDIKKEEADFDEEFEDPEEDKYDRDSDDEDFGGKKKRKTSKKAGKNKTKKSKFSTTNFAEDEAEEDEELSEEIPVRGGREDRRMADALAMPSKKKAPDWFRAENESQVHEMLKRNLQADVSDEDIEHQKILPTKDDPKLFRVKVRDGFERETALHLTTKYLCLKGQVGEEILIYSVAALDRYKTYVFVEAEKKSHVIHALKGCHYVNVDQIKLIEMNEMAEIYKPDPTREVNIHENQWVRIKQPGNYEGDVAKVVTFNENKTRVTVKLVPRLSAGDDEDADEEEPAATTSNVRRGPDATKKKIKPPQRWFDPKEYNDVETRMEGDTKYDVYKKQYFSNGFLFKTLSIKQLRTDNVTPNYDESHWFIQGEVKNFASHEDRTEQIDKFYHELVKIKSEQNKFGRGDKVKITSSDLKNLIGTVISSSENKVVVMPLDEEIKQEMTFYPHQLQKHFTHGDKVFVLLGKNMGKAGTVIKVEDNVATLIAEDTKTEFQCLVNDLIYKEKHNAPTDSLKDYTKYDLVRIIDKETFGVIISIENMSAKIVTNDGNVRSFRSFEIEGKVDTKKNVARNSHNQNISRDCRLRVLDGHYKGKVGQVKHVFKDRAFLYNVEFSSTAGIFVEHINNCYIVNEATRSNPGIQDKSTQAVNEKDRLLTGKQCVVRLGSFKGHKGIVTAVTDKFATIELTSINKSVHVPVDYVDLVNAVGENQVTRNWGGAVGKTPAVRGMGTAYVESPAFSMVSPGYNADLQSPSYAARI